MAPVYLPGSLAFSTSRLRPTRLVSSATIHDGILFLPFRLLASTSVVCHANPFSRFPSRATRSAARFSKPTQRQQRNPPRGLPCLWNTIRISLRRQCWRKSQGYQGHCRVRCTPCCPVFATFNPRTARTPTQTGDVTMEVHLRFQSLFRRMQRQVGGPRMGKFG